MSDARIYLERPWRSDAMTTYEKFDWREPLAGFDPWRNAPDDCHFYPKRAREWCEFFESHIRLARGDGFMGKNINLNYS